MPATLPWPTRLGLLVLLWAVVAALALLIVGIGLPHLLARPALGWCLAALAVTVLVSLLLGAASLTVQLVTGRYAPGRRGPGDSPP